MNMILFDAFPDGALIPAGDERASHILNVLHMKEGDSFRMGIINTSEGDAVIKAISDEGIMVSYEPSCTPSLYPVTLLCAQVRPICMKRILREAVSLGVERIILCGSDTGEKSYLSSNLYKTGEYGEYLLDGAMQSAHAGLPEVLFADHANMAVRLVRENCRSDADLIMLDNVVGAVPLSGATVGTSAVLAIGPERGWSDRERKLFSDSGFRPMLLGSRVLRTETACSAGVAVLLSRMGLL
ncbi:MAG: 16S rRNA (uracil(1498)-N(3))-methyltransferase [bacterium]|jgi:RsmE family RNA methyltransferase|nr:16S rRNA (uracil(1498)-N(3))-methyltransferase [Spirochaetales bacterium]MDT3390019.1 16S rRNA (uracil(1498)-N(3))-methyltransferase [bacterium]